MKRLRGTSWRQHAELRREMLNSIRETPSLIVVSTFWTQFSYLVIYVWTQNPWIAASAAADLAIPALQLHFGRKHQGSQDQSWVDDFNLIAMVVRIALSAGAVFLLARLPSVEGPVLAAMLAIGAVGFVTVRFAAFPSSVMLMIGFLASGLTAGLLTSPFPELFKLGALTPFGAVAFGILTMHAHHGLMERLRAKHENRRLSLHDPLTGLPNRMMMRERLTAMCGKIEDAPRASFAVLCLDLDGFKQVNDRHGHAAGDEVLIGVAKILTSNVADEGLVGRVGGDEFVILLPSGDRRRAVAIAERLIASLSRPLFLARGAEAQIGSTVGIALCPENGATPDALLFSADDALCEAKRSGKGRWLLAAPSEREILSAAA